MTRGLSAASGAVEEVDPEAGTARVVAHLPQPLSHASAVALGGRVYVLGGEAGGAPGDRIWSFDPASHVVSPAGRLPQPVSDGAAATIGSTGHTPDGFDLLAPDGTTPTHPYTG